jgi:hypothetical protein
MFIIIIIIIVTFKNYINFIHFIFCAIKIVNVRRGPLGFYCIFVCMFCVLTRQRMA